MVAAVVYSIEEQNDVHWILFGGFRTKASPEKCSAKWEGTCCAQWFFWAKRAHQHCCNPVTTTRLPFVLLANLLAKMLAMTLLQITGIYDIKKKEIYNLENLGKNYLTNDLIHGQKYLRFMVYWLLHLKSCEIRRLVFDVSEMDNVLEHMIHIGYYSKLL